MADLTGNVRDGEKDGLKVLKIVMKNTIGKKNVVSKYMSDWNFRGEVSCALPKFTAGVLDVSSVFTKWKKPAPNKTKKTPAQHKTTPCQEKNPNQNNSKSFSSNWEVKVAVISYSEEKGKRR